MGNCLPIPVKKKRAKAARSPREKETIDVILSKSSKCQKRNQNEHADMAKALKVEEADENNAALDSPAIAKKAVAFTVEFGVDSPKEVSTDSVVCSKKATAFTANIVNKNPNKVLPDSPVRAKKALAFTVDIDHEKPKACASTKIADKSVKGKEAPSQIVYTNDEESLMDEILMEMEGIKSEKNKEQDVKRKYSLDEKTLMAEIMRKDRLKEIKDKARQEEIKIHDAKMRRAVTERSMEAKLENKTASSVPDVDAQRKRVRDIAAEDRRKAAERRRREEL